MSRRTRSESNEDRPTKRIRTTLEILDLTAARLHENMKQESDSKIEMGWSPFRIIRIPERYVFQSVDVVS